MSHYQKVKSHIIQIQCTVHDTKMQAKNYIIVVNHVGFCTIMARMWGTKTKATSTAVCNNQKSTVYNQQLGVSMC